MNIYDFISSPDVAEHCRRLGHVFNPIESAVIIDRSRQPLTKKLVTYRRLLRQPDMRLTSFDTTLHAYLVALIGYTERKMHEFMQNKSGRRIYSLSSISLGHIPCGNSFDTADGLLSEILPLWDAGRIAAVRVCKKEGGRQSFADFDRDGQMLWTDALDGGEGHPGALCELKVDIPTPFKPNDIVRTVSAFEKTPSLNRLLKKQTDDGFLFYSVDGGFLWDSEAIGMTLTPDTLLYGSRQLSGDERMLQLVQEHIRKSSSNGEILMLSRFSHALMLADICRDADSPLVKIWNDIKNNG